MNNKDEIMSNKKKKRKDIKEWLKKSPRLSRK